MPFSQFLRKPSNQRMGGKKKDVKDSKGKGEAAAGGGASKGDERVKGKVSFF